MTAKAAFNAQEWATITTAPAIVAMLVMASDRGGAIRESVAVQRAYADALAAGPSDFLRSVLTEPGAMSPTDRPQTPQDVHEAAPRVLREAVALLERNATDSEVVEYKRFVYALADKVAHAHREGGFLGIGGTEVSEKERAALDEIAAIFDERQASD
jgi:hypothetical protein